MKQKIAAIACVLFFTGAMALALDVMDLMTFFEQAFILWVCLPVGIGAILAYFMNRTDERRKRLPDGYMSERWTLVNYK